MSGPIVCCSWNVHECVGNDGRRDAARVAAVLREIGADVVALQEVHADERGGELDQPAFLASATGLAPIAGPTLTRHGGPYGNVVLTGLPVAEVRRHDLSVPGREPRGALEVLLEPRHGRLRLVATHLGLRHGERAEQARRLLALVPERVDETLVVLGDWNEWAPWGGALRAARRRFGRQPAPRTFPARRPLVALDRVFVAPSRALLGVATHGGSSARAASDHLPLVARLAPPAGAAPVR